MTTDTRSLGRAALREIEAAADAIPDIEEKIDRIGIGVRLHHVIERVYVVLDRDVDDPAHADGLSLALKGVIEVRALCARASGETPSSPLGRTLIALDVAQRHLEVAGEAAARLQLTLRNFGKRTVAPAQKPFHASLGTPHLQAIARGRVQPPLNIAKASEPPPAPRPPPKIVKPRNLDELRAFQLEAASGALLARIERDEPKEEEPPPPPPARIFAYEPAVDEGEMQRNLARDCLEDMSSLAFLRKPIASESWLDQGPFEQRLLDNLDAFASFGGVGLPIVSGFHAESEVPDSGRAFACGLALASIEGNDTVALAIALMVRAPAPEVAGFAEAFMLAPNPVIDEALVDLLAHARSEVAAAAVDALARRATLPSAAIAPLLARREPDVRLALTRALGEIGDRETAKAALETISRELHGDASIELFAATAEAHLRRGQGEMRERLHAFLADSPRDPRAAVASWLLALVARPDQIELLLGLAAAPTLPWVRGLGRFGHVDAIAPLIQLLHGDDESLREEAAISLDRITGAMLRTTAEVPWQVTLPDDVDLEIIGAGPIPGRTVEKVVDDPAVWTAWWQTNAQNFDPSIKWRGGQPFRPTHILDELVAKATPPPRRFDAALELALALGEGHEVAPDDWVARQKVRLGELRARVVGLSNNAGNWWFAGAGAAASRRVVGDSASRSLSGPASGPPPLGSGRPGALPAMAAMPRIEHSFFTGDSTTTFRAIRPSEKPSPRIDSSMPPSVAPGTEQLRIAAPSSLFAGDPTSAFTLLEYAMLAAQLQLKPEEADRTFAKFGLADPARRAAVDAAWNARLQRDPEELDEYRRLYERALRSSQTRVDLKNRL